MKVRISIPGLYTAMELDDERAYKAFRKLNEVLLSLPSGMPASGSKAVDGVKSECVISHSGPEGVEPESDPEPDRPKYRGFMYIRCPECGTVKGFYMKRESDHYHCDSCGARTAFERPLVPLQVQCECGQRFNYLTNLTDPAFDIPCLNCGAPVAVQWNEKKGTYETIR